MFRIRLVAHTPVGTFKSKWGDWQKEELYKEKVDEVMDFYKTPDLYDLWFETPTGKIIIKNLDDVVLAVERELKDEN